MAASRKNTTEPNATLFDGISAEDQIEPEKAKGPKVLTVSQALQIAKGQLENIHVTVEGEVSEYSDKAGYKAVYFTLTDKDCALPCLIWKSDFTRSDIKLRQGMLVQITGSFSLYAAKGRMNFVARSIKPAGEGDLRTKVAELARKLQAEGLMSAERKRPIPPLAQKVAVVTSPRGKAIHDVLRTLRRRSPQVEVYVLGVPVEGEGAPNAICNGLQVADQSDCDVILLVRGGGSYEDLMPFNDEKVARTVASCLHPVITGIGHEPDNSIADMVADLRCSTPTAAAEASAMPIEQISQWLEQAESKMGRSLLTRLESNKQHLRQICSRPLFTDPNFLLAGYSMRLDADAEKLTRAIPGALANNKQALAQAKLRLAAALPNATADGRRHVERAQASMLNLGGHLLDGSKSKVALAAARLGDLSPLTILSRGYSIAYDDQGHVVKQIDQVSKDDALSVMVGNGYIDCTVDGTTAAEVISQDQE